MHLSSITMKGFKSFPDRTRLEFAKGVSVIVGPNGSGKSNVTDAVLWALGEQSPLAVRGQTMQDVIFSGSRGVSLRTAAEVEVVIDDAERELGTEFSELAIVRRLDRSGDGEYRMNGARCRLVDVLEALSDTGLGKEMHSVVSQGRVEAVVHSSARERRLLIEEAAGLGKHRKRRRRAELKLRRTGDNLSRALDVEREARGRLRPLKRQAEAAQLHARIERQSLEARMELARDDAGAADAGLARAEADARAARSRREDAERRLEAVRGRREEAERAFAGAARAREELARAHFAATAATDRVEMRLERVRALAIQASAGARRAADELRRLNATPEDVAGSSSGGGSARVEELERDLVALDEADSDRPDAEVERLRRERSDADGRRSAAVSASAEREAALRAADATVESALVARRAAAAELEQARSEAARAAAEANAVEQLARGAATAPGGAGALAGHLKVEPGYELALAAALGPRLRAGLARDAGEGASILDASSSAGALMLDTAAPRQDGLAGEPPSADAQPLADLVVAAPPARAAAARLLADVWVVERLDGLREGFRGVAVTRSGRALLAGVGELRQAAVGAEDALVERLGRRDVLARAATETTERARAAEGRASEAAAALSAVERDRDEAAQALRLADRERDLAEEAFDAAERAIVRREAQADEGLAVRRAELAAELRAERRVAERAERDRAARRKRGERLRERAAREQELAATASGMEPAIGAALEAIAAHRESLRAELASDEASGARAGEELRECAREEAEVQAELREAGEVVTQAEVGAQRARDAAAEVRQDLAALLERLQAIGEPGEGVEPEVEDREALSEERRGELAAEVARLAQRRERIGPVNPLAKAEYEEAVAHVEELEAQRRDLETALAELEGIVAETDRRISERFESTFAATARNFEEVVEELFPGGRGRLRLAAHRGPEPVLGGEEETVPDHRGGSDDAEQGAEPDDAPGADEPGVEVEVTPAGKSTRRLSLMSGGERSLVALAFLFAVFLARPCPFYVLDEVEAALDDPNIDRFLRLVRRCSERAQFIVVTHQRRTMDAADRLYGISMGTDGISKVVSRRLTGEATKDSERRVQAA